MLESRLLSVPLMIKERRYARDEALDWYSLPADGAGRAVLVSSVDTDRPLCGTVLSLVYRGLYRSCRAASRCGSMVGVGEYMDAVAPNGWQCPSRLLLRARGGRDAAKLLTVRSCGRRPACN